MEEIKIRVIQPEDYTLEASELERMYDCNGNWIGLLETKTITREEASHHWPNAKLPSPSRNRERAP